MLPLLAPILTMLTEKGLSVASDLISKGGERGLEYIAQKTGIDLKTTPTLTPEQEMELRKLEDSKEAREMANELETNKLKAQVTVNAQNMQMEALKQDDKFSKQFIYWFAIGWSIFSMAYIGFITFGTIPANNVRFADTILGFLLGTAISGILQFFFGSSLGSRKQMESMLGGNK